MLRPFLPCRVVVGSALIVCVLAAAGVMWARSRPDEPPQIPFSRFLRHAERGDLQAVTIGQSLVELHFRDGRRFLTIPPPGYLSAAGGLLSELARSSVEITVRPVESEQRLPVAAMALMFGLLGALGLVAYRVLAGRVPSLESAARTATAGSTEVTLADVAGVDEAKEEVTEIVDFLREPVRFAAIGARVPRGILLVGPPGTGKTLLARSMAGEAGVPFLFASGADFVEMFAGVGAARVRRLFREARRHRACLVFIDELDAVGRRRGGSALSHEEREQTLNQLLVEMDGFEARHGVIVIGATNRPDILDPALLRPGRFDRQVVVSLPDVKGRERILDVHCRKMSLEPDIDLHLVARGTPGFSGADLANLVNEAALLAARTGRMAIARRDFEAARDRLVMGAERRSLVLSDMERTTGAYHEAGHAVVAAVLPGADPIHKISIVPRGRAMGVMMQLPERDRHTVTRDQCVAQVAILMGGRAAEEIFLHQLTSGASNDIERATDLAQRMVCEYGMSPLGPLAFRRPGDGVGGDRPSVLSDETARRVDEEVQRIVVEGYESARRILEARRDETEALVQGLLEWETLEGAALQRLLPNAECRMQNAGPGTPNAEF